MAGIQCFFGWRFSDIRACGSWNRLLVCQMSRLQRAASSTQAFLAGGPWPSVPPCIRRNAEWRLFHEAFSLKPWKQRLTLGPVA